MEYSKNLIDELHGWHSLQPKRLQVNEFTRSAHSLHYYDSILVIEKRHIEPPRREQTGKAEIPDWAAPPTRIKRFKRSLKRLLGRRN